MCNQKVLHRKMTEEQMDLLVLKETIDRLATVNGVRWYGHVLRRDGDSVLRVALDLEVSGKRKQRPPKKTWKKQVEEETEKIGLKKEDILNQEKEMECEQLQNGVNSAIFAKGTIPDKNYIAIKYHCLVLFSKFLVIDGVPP